jgi:hypothetical protein
MPSITKAEYQGLKDRIRLLELKVEHEAGLNKMLSKVWKDEIVEAEKWKRYYDAVREIFKVEEAVEIPGCFNPTESIEYIVKKQEEV